MRLSFQQKEQFFHEMRELLRSGLSIAKALELKGDSRSRSVRRIAKAMLAGTDGTAQSYFAAVPEVFSEMDREIVVGGEKGGRLDETMGYLSEYYGALARTRHRILIHSAYPIFLLHFGAFLLAMPVLIQKGAGAFLVSAFLFLGIFYLAAAILWTLLYTMVRMARVSLVVDQILQSLPGIGGARITLVGSRFCILMEILVKASGSILSALTRSASASGSAIFHQGAQKATRTLQSGDSLSAAIMRTRAFPEAIDRAFQIGEASGRIDEEMHRQATRYNEQFHSRLEILSNTLPKLIYIMIALTLGYRIISFYTEHFRAMSTLLQ